MKHSGRIARALGLAAVAALAFPAASFADKGEKGRGKKGKPPGQAKKEAPPPATKSAPSTEPPPLSESARGVKDGVLGLNFKKVGRSIIQGGERVVKNIENTIEDKVLKPGTDSAVEPSPTGAGAAKDAPVAVVQDVPIEQVKSIKDARPSREGAVGKVF